MTLMLGLATICAVLSGTALLLALYRKTIARKEDDRLHMLDSEAGLVAQQQTVAVRLQIVDRWGMAITVLAVVFGILAGALLLAAAWNDSLKLPS